MTKLAPVELTVILVGLIQGYPKVILCMGQGLGVPFAIPIALLSGSRYVGRLWSPSWSPIGVIERVLG